MTVAILLAAAAGILALWPDAEKPQSNPFLPPVTGASGQDWKAAVDSLFVVRERLSATGMLDADALEALNLLTSSLVNGAGKP